MVLENKSYRERERQLKAEIDKLKGKCEKNKKKKPHYRLIVTRSRIETVFRFLDIGRDERRHLNCVLELLMCL